MFDLTVAPAYYLHYFHRLNNYALKKLIPAIILLLGAFTAEAQIGIKGSVMDPMGDMKLIFKNGKSFEIFYVKNYFKGRLQGRLGYYHANAAPGLDTFRRTTVEFGNMAGTDRLLPGYEVYRNLKMNMLTIDYSFRVASIKDFSFYAGLGLVVGLSRFEYERDIETSIIESGVVNDEVGGLRGNVRVAYNIIGHVQVFAEASHSAVVETHWSTGYSHNNVGIGVNYFFKPLK